ncbi:MAG: ZIP family metal transporter [Phycisphaerales bacterium]|jgi:zinc and cadmium transporter
MIWAYAMVSVVLVSLLSLLGLMFLAADEAKLRRVLLILVSFAIGGLSGDAFIHLIPESFRQLGFGLSTSLLMILGMFLFFVVERLIRWRHCHLSASEHHIHPVAALNLTGDAVHNLLDGVVIGASYSVSVPLGVTTTLAVLLHEIPHEIGDFGILVHAGFSVRMAILFNFLTALTAILGTILALMVGPHVQAFSVGMLPITAGGFIYIAGSDLIPEVQAGCDSVWITAIQFLAMVLGIAIMALLILIG